MSELPEAVEKYFQGTATDEQALDIYLDSTIREFLHGGDPKIHAAIVHSRDKIRDIFGKHKLDDTRDVQDYIHDLQANVLAHAFRAASPRMIGHMTASALPYFQRGLARLICATNNNLANVENSTTLTLLERETLGLLHSLLFHNESLDYPEIMHAPDLCLGVFTSGGTVANLTAMWVARNNALGPRPDAEPPLAGVQTAGLARALIQRGYEGACIIGSERMHYSFKKSADILGLGTEGLVLIPTDENYRVRTDLMEQKIMELKESNIMVIAVVGVAGTTETGSIDDLNAVADLAQTHGIHFHVDAAWGGPMVFAPKYSHLLAGIERGDSITIDGHKQLYTPNAVGMLLFRNPEAAANIRNTANYIVRESSPDLGRYTLEGSRPATSLHVHASLSLLGPQGIGAIVERSCDLTKKMAKYLSQHPSRCFEVLHQPMSNLLLYRFVPKFLHKRRDAGELTGEDQAVISKLTREIQERQSRSGNAGFVSRTSLFYHAAQGPVDAFRVVIANPLTVWRDIVECLEEQLVMGQELMLEM
ncbi:putative pyridoxal-dependent aspartate 1-decarboxylase [Polychytrium aggregatum]|uniref:putative pyridoxal-dependent aspartate 1-decarboxylase n=1 Tax=Polychytrium aggregatum TaxID=110093 RepID=UPI0022FED121|nr:putative pyridoxal-dependent aspartate 1-decarboxylase [Polychytrium aggregatum]KAI9193413.1 putative pyridoxal-dependent aspartate 1-decarboxylase [Polychytrium aggregatum]